LGTIAVASVSINVGRDDSDVEAAWKSRQMFCRRRYIDGVWDRGGLLDALQT
jgi:hypothetical protein